MLHLIGKQVYKLKLPKKLKIYNIFHILLLKQNTTKNKQVDKKITELKFQANNIKK